MTTAADLRPHKWEAPESTHARVALQCAIQGNFARMAEHLAALPSEALTDLAYALDVMHPNVKLMAGIKPMAPDPPDVRHQSVRVPCGRCGHEEWRHRRWSETSSGAMAGTDCFECPGGRCQPVVVPVPGHVEGWPIEGGRQ